MFGEFLSIVFKSIKLDKSLYSDNKNFSEASVYFAGLIMILDGIAGVKFLLNGNIKAFWAILRAHFWQYANMVQTLKKRREIKAGTTIENTKGQYTNNILMEFFFRKNKTFSKLDKNKLK